MTAELLNEFHFLRPEWFFALIPAVLLFLVLRARHARNSNWETTIDPTLLPFLLDSAGGGKRGWPMALLLIAWLLATTALAGPVWRKTPQPVHEREDALVVIFDLTRSMYAEDVQPNRLIRARRKLQDLLDSRSEGVTGLIVFAGDAHTVSPLTDDAATIKEMIPAISPEIMPAPGSELAPALDLAINLFRDAGAASGRILIITDEIRDIAESQRIAREYQGAYPISVLSVGTPEGAPIPADNFATGGGYLKDQQGVLVIPRVDIAALSGFAGIAGGRFARMTLTDEDLDYLLADEPLPGESAFRTLERDFDVWIEEGPWLLLLLLPLAALAFRRGWLWSIPLLFILPVEQADASFWDDLWQTRDQQGIEALEAGDPVQAASLFEDPAWKGSAQYRTEAFEAAAKQFANLTDSPGKYNLGNALAKQGKLEEAISAYDEALTLDPDNEDAAFNKALVEELLQQQQQSEQNQQQDQENQDQQDQEKQNEDGQKGQDGENQQQDNQEQEDQQQQDSEGQPEQQAEEQDSRQQMAEQETEPLDEEEQQALEQWLRRVPDDPGGLLRRKFELQHAERMKQIGSSRNDKTANW
ncbi:MAG: VWA domain-containing protein [Pseudomonadota bacterium]